MMSVFIQRAATVKTRCMKGKQTRVEDSRAVTHRVVTTRVFFSLSPCHFWFTPHVYPWGMGVFIRGHFSHNTALCNECLCMCSLCLYSIHISEIFWLMVLHTYTFCSSQMRNKKDLIFSAIYIFTNTTTTVKCLSTYKQQATIK